MLTRKLQRTTSPLGATVLILILLVSTPGVVVQADGPASDKLITNDPSGTDNKSQVEPAIAVNPNDPTKVVAVAIDYRENYKPLLTSASPDPWFWLYVTCDNWTSPPANIALPGRPIRDPNRPNTVFGRLNITHLGDPGLAFDKADNFYVAGLAKGFTSGTPGPLMLFVAKARLDCADPSNPALNFEPFDANLKVVVTPVEPDKPFIAVDSRPTLPTPRIFVGWRTQTSVYFSYTHQWGNDFGHILLETSATGDGTYHVAVAVASNGDVYAAYFIANQFIRVKRSTDGGVSFPQVGSIPATPRTDVFRILGNARTPPVLSISTDPTSHNIIYIVWDDDRDLATRGSDILFTYSGDYGASWGSPIRVNDSVGNSEQFWPWVVSPDPGVVDVIYYNVTSNGVELLYAPSFTLTSFQPNIIVTDAAFKLKLQLSDCTPPLADPDFCYFVGDYIGMSGAVKSDGTETFIRPVWTGTRDGVRSDIYTDTIVRSRGGGSPYVYVWNDTGFSLDNNLLPASARGYTGTDLTDWYLLQKPLVKDRWGHYNLMIKELENDHSFFDQAQLWAVDHSTDTKVAVTSSGQVLTFRSPSPALTAVDETGVDATYLLSAQDGAYYEGTAGSYLLLNFGSMDVSQGAKLVLRADPPCSPACKMSIYIQTLDSLGSWQTRGVVIPRVYWSIDIVNLAGYLPDPNGELKVRLYFTLNHRLDFVGLDTSPEEPIDIQTQPLLLAASTAYGDITAKLATSDNTYGELLPDQALFLVYDSTPQTREARSFIIIVEGYYIPA